MFSIGSVHKRPWQNQKEGKSFIGVKSRAKKTIDSASHLFFNRNPGAKIKWNGGRNDQPSMAPSPHISTLFAQGDF